MDVDEIKTSINVYVEKEAEKMYHFAVENNSTLKDLRKILWERGKTKRDGDEIDRTLHHLIYLRFAEKIDAASAIIERAVMKNALPKRDGSAE